MSLTVPDDRVAILDHGTDEYREFRSECYDEQRPCIVISESEQGYTVFVECVAHNIKLFAQTELKKRLHRFAVHRENDDTKVRYKVMFNRAFLGPVDQETAVEAATFVSSVLFESDDDTNTDVDRDAMTGLTPIYRLDTLPKN